MGQLVFQATLGGQVNLVGPNTASTYNINVPTVNGTLVTTGDTGTVSSTMLASSLSLTTPNIGAATGTSLAVTAGLYSSGAYAGSYTDGIVVDYTTGLGRISVGTSDGIAFYNGGVASSEKMRLDSSGNLGIGTSSPTAKLDVYGSATAARSTSAQLSLKRSATTSYSGIQFPTGAAKAAFFGTPASSDDLIFGFDGGSSLAEAMRIDTSGNVGIGTSSPAGKFNVSGSGYQYSYFDGGASTGGSALVLRQGTTNSVVMGNYAAVNGSGSSNDAVLQAPNGNMQLQVTGASYMRFDTNNTERARIDSSGNLLVGVSAWADGGGGSFIGNRASSGINGKFSCSSTSNQVIFYFTNPNGVVGLIQASGSTTSYVTSSDYRLKENVQPMSGALAKVAALKPCTYTWKVDGSEGQGFIAHELQEVVPDCVTGTKDAVDDDGKPIHQGIDTSFLVATLTAAIQEQQAIIQQLQADVASLKASQ